MELLQYRTAEELAQEAALRFLEAMPPVRPWRVGLSGGRVSKLLFQQIAQFAPPGLNFSGIHFFFADERCVPPEDPESNYGIANRLLFEPLRLAREQVHRIRGEIDPAEAAREAEAELRRLAPLNPAGQPMLDLLILGMGEDGHTASLFPGESRPDMESLAVYRPVVAPKPPPKRISLGYSAIAAAVQVWVLASGPGKEAALARVLREKGAFHAATPLAKALLGRSKGLILSDIAALQKH